VADCRSWPALFATDIEGCLMATSRTARRTQTAAGSSRAIRRVVERKKYGKAKARRSFQFSKR